MRRFWMAVAAAVATLVGSGGVLFASALPTSADNSFPTRYKHVFYVVEENREYGQIVGNPGAPNLNQLANTYGVATAYYGTSHPSEPNYVAMIGGSDYGIKDDAPYNSAGHTINQPSLASQLEGAGLSWKDYQQSLPFPGFTGTAYPAASNALYASKHNGFMNFASIQNSPSELAKVVPIEQLNTDLPQDTVPSFSFIVPDQCHDMHGLASCPNGATNVTVADTYAGQLVKAIMSSNAWKLGNNAIVLTFDEGNTTLGCCDANPGGGRVLTIVIANHGLGAVQDATPANHYSMLQTIERAFGLGCIQNTCDTADVKPLTRLFATAN